MSILKRDPSITMEELKEIGQRFLDAGQEYWEAAQKAGIDGAIIWLTGDDDRLIIYTRGEYRQQLIGNIERHGPIRHFGHTTKDY